MSVLPFLTLPQLAEKPAGVDNVINSFPFRRSFSLNNSTLLRIDIRYILLQYNLP